MTASDRKDFFMIHGNSCFKGWRRQGLECPSLRDFKKISQDYFTGNFPRGLGCPKMLSEPGCNACHHNAVHSKHKWSYLQSFTTSYDVSFGAPKVDLHLCGIPKWWNRSHAKHHSWSSWKPSPVFSRITVRVCSNFPSTSSRVAGFPPAAPVAVCGAAPWRVAGPAGDASAPLGSSELNKSPVTVSSTGFRRFQVTTKWKVILLLCYCMVTSGY